MEKCYINRYSKVRDPSTNGLSFEIRIMELLLASYAVHSDGAQMSVPNY
jgi:hypothetical protein